MNLFVFGLGYSASHFVAAARAGFDRVAGTVRAPGPDDGRTATDVAVLRFDGDAIDPALPAALADSDALLVSVQPGAALLGTHPDPVLSRFADAIAAAPRLRSITYLSTIGVYGDHGGAWIDESAPPRPDNDRQGARVEAERAWLDLGRRTGRVVHVLRLAGIYGPGRNVLADLRRGEARRIDKPGQVFNRIHVADIAAAIGASFRHGGQHGGQAVLNVADDEPAPAPDVVRYAAELMGVAAPPLVPFAEAALSPMALSFYGANRRVSNAALKRELGIELRYPTYRDGLDALWAAGEGRP